MASKEECNKSQCKNNLNNEQERNFIVVYKKLEQVLNNKNGVFTKKVESLIEAWRQVCQYSTSEKVPYIVQLMDWAKLHTLNIVLNGDWKKYKDIYEKNLLTEVELTEKQLFKLNNVFSTRCKKLAEVIRDPWGNPILYRLLNTTDAAIGPEEIEFFCVETGYLVSMRLKKLCESQCEDLALNLVTAFIRCYRLAETQQFNLNATEKQKWFIFDVYIALLFKYKKTPLILSTLKSLSLQDGFEVVKRFTNKRVTISKIWRHSAKITQLACQVYITATIMKPVEETGDMLREFLKIWFAQNEADSCLEPLMTTIRRIIQAADSAGQMYIFCESVYEKFGPKMKTFTIELYIRALTTDMNDMERQKNENEAEKVIETTRRLASGFCRLADILEEHLKASRECVLTAFSLQPTLERLKRIENLARLCGYEVLDTGQEWKCKLHPPVLESDEISWVCNVCGEFMSQPQLEAAINTNTALSEALTAEHLGLSPQLCDDLAVVLSSPRYQVFSWLLRWGDLRRLCNMYLQDPERTKNLVTELKFVDIDYSLFTTIKKEPLDEEQTGIERGYEQFLESEFYSDGGDGETLSEDSASQDSRPYSLGSDGAGDSPNCFVPAPQPKSDPNILKSLRMFRPNLKRARQPQNEEKVFVGSAPSCSANTPPGGVNEVPYKYTAYLPPYANLSTMYSGSLSNVYNNPKNNSYVSNGNNEAAAPLNYKKSNLDKQQLLESESFPKTGLVRTYAKKHKMGKADQKLSSEAIVTCTKEISAKFMSDCAIRRPETSSKNEIGATLPPTSAGMQVAVNKREAILNTLHTDPKASNNQALPLKSDPESVQVPESQKENHDLMVKYNLKEAKVLLNRVNMKSYISKKLKRKIECKRFEDVGWHKPPLSPHVVITRLDDKKNETDPPKTTNKISLSPKQPLVLLKRLQLNDIPTVLSKTKETEPKETNSNPERDKNKLDVKSVLANVPGLNDLELMRPSSVNQIVQVVQIAGGRPTSSVTPQNTQTSTTQVSPHIQRIGVPRTDKPEQTSEATTTTTNSTPSTPTKPVTSQSSTLINILSQQIIRPGQSNCIRNRTSPLINILSQQIIRPANTVTTPAKPPTTTTTSESSSVPKLEQVIPPRNQTSTIKTIVGSNPPDQNHIVQFICKSTDGKLIPVTSFASSRVVKVATTQTVTSTAPTSPAHEETFTKLVKVAQKQKNDSAENSDTLPKFQQAFGKTVYQNNVDGTSTSTEIVEADKKIVAKASAVNVQPVQGSVIYTRQMPVGQTINLIPPGRGQVFRIASTSSDPTVIRSKMTALLAAALQGKKSTESSDADNSGSEDVQARVTVSCPTLVQSARIVKPVLHIPSNVTRINPQPNVSSTTLEQLREFDMVYKQVKERSNTNTGGENALPENNEPSQRISVTYLNQGQKLTQLSPVVVVSSYCNLQPAASPALSVTSQGSSSPCVTPAPTPTLPKVSSKNSKGKSVKNTITHASKASPIPKPQQKPQEDEHTTQRIFDILAEYAEQLRNSPDLNNKPAPRRRSNPPTNPNQNSKRKKSSGSKKTGQCSSTLSSDADIEDPRTIGSEDSSCGVVQLSMQDDEQPSTPVNTSESNDTSVSSCQQLILTDSSHNQTRNLIIADSSVGEALKMPNTAVLVPGNYIMPVSMVKGGQQIAVVSGGSKILATVPARSGPNMLLFQSFLNQKSGVPAVKYSSISGISSQAIAGVNAQPPVILPTTSHSLSAVTLGQPIALKKMSESDRVNTELLLTISQPHFGNNENKESVNRSDNRISITNIETTELEQSTTQPESEKVYNFDKTHISNTSIATPVISQAENVKELPENVSRAALEGYNKGNVAKPERVQSVLVTACTSNGPMLSHTPPNYCKTQMSNATGNAGGKEEFLRNGSKQSVTDQKNYQNNAIYMQKAKKAAAGSQRLDRELHQLSLQRKQAAYERELRLQKSLSEECEDLGVDEPSTSDLFPEADLLFDSNHSPSFDQSPQEPKRAVHSQEVKEEKPMTLFSDDDNSSSLRTDFLFEPVEYQTEADLAYGRSRQLTNGQSSTSNESGSSCEDNTLLQNCTSMSDVTLNSPMTPETYADNTPPALNKYKYKYSNRKKAERHKPAEAWPVEVSSSEDTTGSTELIKSSSRSPELCLNKRSHSLSCDEDLSDSSFKVVRVAISKNDFLKVEETCEDLHCEDDIDSSPSGRGARRSVKKLCSCCNGSQDGAASRKRPASLPHTASPHKKAFLAKRR